MNRMTTLAGFSLVAAASTAYAGPTNGSSDTVLAASTSEPAVTIPVLQDGDRVFWKHDLRFASGDGATNYRIGGRIQFDGRWIGADDGIDAATFDDDDDGSTAEIPSFDTSDNLGFRRARLYIAGKIYGNVGFKAQYDFAGSDRTVFKDLYLTIDNFLIGQLRIGQMKEPFGLENSMSSNDTTFMEIAGAMGIATGRSAGFQFSDWDEDSAIGWGAGFFGSDSDSTGNSNVEMNGYALTGRVTWAPTYDLDNNNLVHVGASVTVRGDGGANLGASEISGFKNLDSGVDAIDDDTRIGVEAVGIWGPLSIQSEYITAMVDFEDGTDADLNGYYLNASYSLTGESRSYHKGMLGGVTPNSNWGGFGQGGSGAWEVALRYSMLDLDGTDVSGITAGANWYLNPNTRIMMNYVMQTLGTDGSPDLDVDAIQMRFQVTF